MALSFPARATVATEALPLDVLPLILEHLSDRRDLCTCAQLSKAFHNAATPLLYRTLDVRVVTHDNSQVSRVSTTVGVEHPACISYGVCRRNLVRVPERCCVFHASPSRREDMISRGMLLGDLMQLPHPVGA